MERICQHRPMLYTSHQRASQLLKSFRCLCLRGWSWDGKSVCCRYYSTGMAWDGESGGNEAGMWSWGQATVVGDGGREGQLPPKIRENIFRAKIM